MSPIVRKFNKTFVKKGLFRYEEREQQRGKSVKAKLFLSVAAISLLFFFSIADATRPPQPVDTNKHVLVINSYHKGYLWTDNTLAGIESVLKDGKKNIELHIEFMDSKRVVDQNHFHRLFLYYRSKFNQIKFDLIIVSDNDAFNFVLRYRDALFPKIPIVFCGVNALNEMLQKNVPLLTGVVEDYDIRATLDVALKLHPNAREIIAVNNGTPIGAVKKQLFNDALAATGKNLTATIIDDPILEDFEKLLKDKGKEVIEMLLGSFRVKSGAMVPIEVSTPILARYDVPLYGLIEYYLDYGIIGGKLISGYHQGALAAQMGLRILHGEPVDMIPIERKSPNIYMFDYNQIVKFGIPQEVLPEGSVIRNQPKAAPPKDNTIVWGAIIVFFSLGMAAVFLVLYIRSRKKAEESLEKLSVEQEKRIEARTEELKKSNLDLRQKIAEMKQTEAALTESYQKYLTLFRYLPNPAFVVDEDFHFRDWNEKTLELFEGALDEIRNMDARRLVPEDLLVQVLEALVPSEGVKSIEAHLKIQDKRKTLLLNIVPVTFSGEKFIFGIGQDITELKQEQTILRDNEMFLRKVIAILPSPFMITGRDGTVKYVNEEFLRISLFSRDDLPTIDAWLHKAYPAKSRRDAVYAAWLNASKAEKSTAESTQVIESTIVTKDGLSLEKELRFIPVHDGVLIVIGDIPTKKHFEDRTPISRNQESIETLAAGIAHDFNNLLLVILGNISLAKTSLTQEDKALERLIEAQRASLMTKD